jgi:2-methylisocitrate lyase-like PEP mutase family enzyme
MNTSTKAKAAAFHRLHHTDQILLLPNCWDVLSAVVLKAAGAKAIATTSAGLAWAHGYADGEKLPVESLIHAVREITRIIDLPVTVDLPLNVLATRGVATIPEIEKTGAKRLSVGARLTEAVFGRLNHLATEFLHGQSLEGLFAESLPFAEINKLLS